MNVVKIVIHILYAFLIIIIELLLKQYFLYFIISKVKIDIYPLNIIIIQSIINLVFFIVFIMKT